MQVHVLSCFVIKLFVEFVVEEFVGDFLPEGDMFSGFSRVLGKNSINILRSTSFKQLSWRLC